MKNFLDFIFEWLEHEESFIFWMVLLNITASWVTFSAFRKGRKAFVREFFILACDISLAFFTASIIDFTLYCLLKNHVAALNTAKFILTAINFCLFSMDLFTLYYFNMPLNDIMYEVIMMTTARETSEFARAYLINYKFWRFVCAVLLTAFLLRFSWIQIINPNPILRFSIFALGLMLGFFAVWRVLKIYAPDVFIPRLTDSTGLTRLAMFIYHSHINMKNHENMVNQSPKSVTLTKNESSIPYIVYILGESTTRNHMSLYGYKLPTNPL